MTSKNLVSGLAAVALLALASCSAEPSDLRPQYKVSNDLVAPGTRESDNFDLHTDAPSQRKGGAIEAPINSSMDVEQTMDPAKGNPNKPNATEAMTPDATKAEGGDRGTSATKGQTETPQDLNDQPEDRNEN